MPNHIWGDEWFQKHGKDLDSAISYCMRTWRIYGRIGSHGKEKYGTFRDHCNFYRAWWPIHELVKPGYVRYKWPKWLMNVEIFLGQYIIKPLKISKLVQFYQIIIYNYAIQQACKKYPEIVDEIVADLDGYELVRPGIFGNIDGKKIHDKYWVTVS